MVSAPVIAIIGGGFCGMMTAVHLCRQAKIPLVIRIINDGHPFGRGIAYQAASKQYLLNVRAHNMSAFAEAPLHFVHWLQQQPAYTYLTGEQLADEFVPRKVYGDYLASVWAQAQLEKPACLHTELITDTAVDITPSHSGYTIQLRQQGSLSADYIVLATGNSKPRMPMLYQQHYVHPWSSDWLHNARTCKEVLIAGNGLTMADTVLALYEQGFAGRVHTISPNGFALRSHAVSRQSYIPDTSRFGQCRTLQQWRQVVYRQLVHARQQCLPPELVIDALRPYTAAAWQQFGQADKQQFIKQWGYVWNILRHRLPAYVYDALHQLRRQQRLVSYKGHITHSATDDAGNIQVTFYNKNNVTLEQLTVQKLINCTGPETDITESSNPLLRNLSRNGLIMPDALRLGIEVNSNNYTIIDQEGHNRQDIFTIGASLKGLLWESTAVPELRIQCQQIASYLLATTVRLKEEVRL